MSALAEADKLEELEFKWGKKRGVGKKQNIHFYESFTYDGMEYNLYDCVYLYKEGEPKPYIGKLVKIWELTDKWKKVKIHWFFRPSEISYYLKDEKVMTKEIFLASGQGVGLSNVNPLEAVAGKCNVICISKDSRNPQPSSEELQMADYLFYRTFNVDSCTISDEIGEKVGDLEVKFIFNRKSQIETLSVNAKNIDSDAFDDRPSKREKLDNSVQTSEGKDKDVSSIKRLSEPGHDVKAPGSDVFYAKGKSESVVKDSVELGKDVKMAEATNTLEDRPTKKMKVGNAVKISEVKNKNNIQKLNTKSVDDWPEHKLADLTRVEVKAHPKPLKSPIGLDNGPPKEKPSEKKTSKLSTEASGYGKKIMHGEIVKVTRRPNLDKNTWFRELPWEERIQGAQEQGKLVLLQNLDPDYTSGEVEDIIWHAFGENCTAKMVHHTAVSSPHSGRALVIFKSKEAADKVIRRLHDGCLMLSNGRPLIGSVARLPKLSGKQPSFVGHLCIDKDKHKMAREMREAVSTSHYSQPNTIEYEMAMDWFTLQARSDHWWKTLYEQQAGEIEKVKANLKWK